MSPATRARMLVMGIVNVTPDSFSDGGRFIDPLAAVEHARRLVADGADMLDVGAESTRPGFDAVPADEQLRRLRDVLPGIKDIGVPFSIDTRAAAVAEVAVAAGASMVNDVSGGTHDPEMLGMVAGLGVDYVCQLWGRDPHIPMRDQLAARLDACLAAGIDRNRIVLDPGLGFGPDPQDDWPALAHIDDATALGQRVLVGASRKRFLATPGDDALGREDSGVAVTAWCAQHGVWAVRTHTVAPHKRAIDVITRLMECRAHGDLR